MIDKYRSDIDGLRAIAIVPVMLYHADVTWFSGGFVGVDVFYVISGYLITRIIVDEIDRTGTFSFLNFYERRLRRIYPPLVAMLALTSVLAVFFLLPSALKSFGESLIAASLFVANLFFRSHSGYFAPAADRLPLLHTWSLAVEEQFYIFFPPFLMLLARTAKKAIVPVIAAGAIVSFTLNCYLVGRYPQYTFFLAPFRAWELALGALIALGTFPPITNPRIRSGVGALGLGMILAAVSFYSSTTTYPGVAAALPCVGAALLVHAGGSGPSITSSILSMPVLVGLGLISYSLYLWHWPLLVFARYASLDGPSPTVIAAVLAMSFCIAVLSWRYLERPIRRRVIVRTPLGLCRAAGFATAALLTFGVICVAGGGLPGRMTTEALALDKASHDENFDELSCHDVMEGAIRADRLCKVGDPFKPASWMVWGDSDAWALRPAIDKWMRENNESGWISSRGGCPPLLGVVRSRWEPCSEPNEATLDFIARHKVEKVLLAAAWSGYPSLELVDNKSSVASPAETRRVLNDAVDATCAALASHGARIYLFDPIPGAKMNVPDTLGRAAYFNKKVDIRFTLEEFKERNRILDDAFQRNSRFISGRFSPEKALCSTGMCAVLTSHGSPLYSDANHPSSGAADVFVDILRSGYSPNPGEGKSHQVLN